jgi:hypothetical protein
MGIHAGEITLKVFCFFIGIFNMRIYEEETVQTDCLLSITTEISFQTILNTHLSYLIVEEGSRFS